MPIFFRFRVLESKPPTLELGGSELFANICASSTDDVVPFLSQLCGSDWPATSVWIEVVITLLGSSQDLRRICGSQLFGYVTSVFGLNYSQPIMLEVENAAAITFSKDQV